MCANVMQAVDVDFTEASMAVRSCLLRLFMQMHARRWDGVRLTFSLKAGTALL